MEGAAHAAKRAFDRDIALAWHTAAFGAAAQSGKLKNLSTYQNPPKIVKAAQSPNEMLEAMRAFQDMGAPMVIKQVN